MTTSSTTANMARVIAVAFTAAIAVVIATVIIRSTSSPHAILHHNHRRLYHPEERERFIMTDPDAVAAAREATMDVSSVGKLMAGHTSVHRGTTGDEGGNDVVLEGGVRDVGGHYAFGADGTLRLKGDELHIKTLRANALDVQSPPPPTRSSSVPTGPARIGTGERMDIGTGALTWGARDDGSTTVLNVGESTLLTLAGASFVEAPDELDDDSGGGGAAAAAGVDIRVNREHATTALELRRGGRVGVPHGRLDVRVGVGGGALSAGGDMRADSGAKVSKGVTVGGRTSTRGSLIASGGDIRVGGETAASAIVASAVDEEGGRWPSPTAATSTNTLTAPAGLIIDARDTLLPAGDIRVSQRNGRNGDGGGGLSIAGVSIDDTPTRQAFLTGMDHLSPTDTEARALEAVRRGMRRWWRGAERERDAATAEVVSVAVADADGALKATRGSAREWDFEARGHMDLRAGGAGAVITNTAASDTLTGGGGGLMFDVKGGDPADPRHVASVSFAGTGVGGEGENTLTVDSEALEVAYDSSTSNRRAMLTLGHRVPTSTSAAAPVTTTVHGNLFTSKVCNSRGERCVGFDGERLVRVGTW